MSVFALDIKEIKDDGHRWRSSMIQSTDDGFQNCSLDRAEPIRQSVLAG